MTRYSHRTLQNLPHTLPQVPLTQFSADAGTVFWDELICSSHLPRSCQLPKERAIEEVFWWVAEVFRMASCASPRPTVLSCIEGCSSLAFDQNPLTGMCECPPRCPWICFPLSTSCAFPSLRKCKLWLWVYKLLRHFAINVMKSLCERVLDYSEMCL